VFGSGILLNKHLLDFCGVRQKSIQTLNRCGVALFFVALFSGCAVTSPKAGSVKASDRGGDCTWNRSSCMYEGSYEPGERDYAEQEAKRLNQAASVKLRRRGGR